MTPTFYFVACLQIAKRINFKKIFSIDFSNLKNVLLHLKNSTRRSLPKFARCHDVRVVVNMHIPIEEMQQNP